MRRFIHVLLLVVLVIGVRACGGAAATEDRLAAGTRWVAEKTGLAAVQGTWDRAVRPTVSSATNSLSDTLYQATSRMLDRTETALDGLAMSMMNGMNTAVNWAWTTLRSTINPNQGQQPAPAPGAASPSTESRANQ